MQTIDRIRDEIAKRGVSVLKVSNETGISAYKIYKWLGGKAKPKHEDTVILEKWLRNKLEKVPRETDAAVTEQAIATTTQDAEIIKGVSYEELNRKYLALLEKVAKADLSDVKEKLEEIGIGIEQNRKLLQVLVGEDPNEADVPGLSDKKQDTKTYKKSIRDVKGKPRI